MKIKSTKIPQIIYYSLIITLFLFLLTLIWETEIIDVLFKSKSLYLLSFIAIFIIFILLIYILTFKNCYLINKDSIIKRTYFILEHSKLIKYNSNRLTIVEKNTFFLSIFNLTKIIIVDNNNRCFSGLLNSKEIYSLYEIIYSKKTKEPYESRNVDTDIKNKLIYLIFNSVFYYLIFFVLISVILLIFDWLSIIDNISISNVLIIPLIFVISGLLLYYSFEDRMNIKLNKNYMIIKKGIIVKSTIRIPYKSIKNIINKDELLIIKRRMHHILLKINDSYKINLLANYEVIKEIKSRI